MDLESAKSSLLYSAEYTLVCLAIGIVVYLLSRALKLQYQGWAFPRPKQAAIFGLASVSVSMLLSSMLLLIGSRGGQSSTSPRAHYNLNAVVNYALLYLLQAGPVLIVMHKRKEPWASAGISRHNLTGSLVVGLLVVGSLLAARAFFAPGGVTTFITRLNADHFWASLCFAVVGFAEEFLFRGYLQTRLIAWLGKWQGWLLTSILMAMVHITQRIAVMGLSPMEAIISSALLIPVNLLLGYMMLRTDNVIGPALLHIYADWINTLS